MKTSSTRYHYLPRYKYQKRHLRMLLSVYQPRKQLRHKLNLRCLSNPVHMIRLHLLQVNWKFNIRWSHYILDFEIRVPHRKTHLVNYLSVLSTCRLTLLLRSRTSYNHLSTTKYQPCGFGVPQPHNDSSKTIGIVLCCLPLPCNFLQIQFATQINSTHHILYLG